MLACFILDVHPSMGKRSPPCGPPAQASRNLRGSGLSSLEWAKSSIEYFIRARQKANFKDQYFLLTTEEGPGCVRASWGDNLQRFDDQLRLLAPLPADGSRGGTNVGRALSTAFALLNQYRLQNGTDNYGQGRCPWLVEPGCCLLFSDGESLRPTPPPAGTAGSMAAAAAAQAAAEKASAAGMAKLKLTCSAQDLTRDPYRWDHRFFPLVVQQPQASSSRSSSSDNKDSSVEVAMPPPPPPPPPIAVYKALAEATGGYYSVSDSLMGLNMKMDLILHKLSFVGPVIVLAPDTSTEAGAASSQQQQQQQQQQMQQQEQEQSGSKDQQGNTSLPPPSSSTSTTSSSSSSSDVPPSPTVRAILSLNQESAGFNWPIPEAFWLDRALEHLPRRDAHPTLIYRRMPSPSSSSSSSPSSSAELTDPTLTTLALLESQGLPMDRYPLEWCGGGGGGGTGGGSSLKMGRDARWPVYLQDSSRQKGSKGDPFGYLEASELAGRVTLVLLPYNYPKLASLVQQAVERGSASGHLTSLPVKWRPEFNQFLAQTPPYYYPALRRSLKRMGLHTQVPENKTGGLSQVVVKRLQRLRDQGREENQRYEVSRNEHPHYCVVKGGGGGGVEFEAAAELLGALGGGKEGGQGGQSSLLSMWEGVRQRLFGEGGHVTSGLYVKGFKSWHGACGSQKRGREGGSRTLLTEVGALQVPQNPIMEMGAYTETLLKTEMLRDPLAEHDPEEDTPEAWLQRKLAVNFGNPFRQQQHHHPHHHPPQQQQQREGRGGREGGRRGGGGGGGEMPVRVMLSAEAENEAAVLGPHSSLGEDLEGGEEGREEGVGLGMLLSGWGGSGEGGGEGGGGGNSNGSGGQPARKRQRMNELPPLPTARKLRRHQQPSSSSAPAVAAAGAAASPANSMIPLRTHPSSPPLTPMVASVLPPALPSLNNYEEERQEKEEAEEGEAEEEGGEEGTLSGLDEMQVDEGEEEEEGEEREEGAVVEDLPAPLVAGGGGGGGTTAAALAPAPAPAAAGSGAGRGGSGTSTAAVATSAVQPAPAPQQAAARPASAPAPASALTATTAVPAAPAPAVPRRSIEEMLKDKDLTTPNADGWMLAWSKREKRLYYFNIKTNVAVWTSPPGLPPINGDT